MGFFDNLGKKASKAYDVTAEKTGKLAIEDFVIVKDFQYVDKKQKQMLVLVRVKLVQSLVKRNSVGG